MPLRSSKDRFAGAAALVAAVLVAGPTPLQGQDEATRACWLIVDGTDTECRFVVGAAGVIQPRLAAALFAGNPVPGTASTLGMRLGSLPRISLAFQVTAAPAELPPIRDRSVASGERTLLWGFTADAAVGLLAGFSPLPTVGGVLSLDLIARAGYLPLSRGAGFHDGGVFGWALGTRVGALRESFTLPGVALTATYGRLGRTAFGDPRDEATGGFFNGPLSELRLGLAATKRVALVGLTGGVAWSRYASDLEFGYMDGGSQVRLSGEAVHERWSGYVNAAWTLLIFHASAEVGWQQAPVPGRVPTGVAVDPVGWFAGVAFRVSI